MLGLLPFRVCGAAVEHNRSPELKHDKAKVDTAQPILSSAHLERALLVARGVAGESICLSRR